MALGRQADTCAAKTSSGDCAGVSGCSWNSGTSLCDVADATVKSIVGVETLAGVFSTWNTCQSIRDHSRSCTADSNCKWVSPQLRNYEQKSRRDVCRRHGRQYVQDVHLRWYLLHELPRIGWYYICCKSCLLVVPSLRERTAQPCRDIASRRTFSNTPWPVSRSVSISHRPRLLTMLNEAYPGYDKRCPNVMEQFLAQSDKCEEATSKQAECGAGDYSNCKWSASATCEYDE